MVCHSLDHPQAQAKACMLTPLAENGRNWRLSHEGREGEVERAQCWGREGEGERGGTGLDWPQASSVAHCLKTRYHVAGDVENNFLPTFVYSWSGTGFQILHVNIARLFVSPVFPRFVIFLVSFKPHIVWTWFNPISPTVPLCMYMYAYIKCWICLPWSISTLSPFLFCLFS